MTQTTTTTRHTLRAWKARRRYRHLQESTGSLSRTLERTITAVDRVNLLRRYAVVVTEMASLATVGWPNPSPRVDSMAMGHQSSDLTTAARLLYICADAETCRARRQRTGPSHTAEADERPQGDPVLETVIGPALDTLATGHSAAKQLDSYGDIASYLARSSAVGEYTIRTAVALSQVSGDPLLM